MRTSQLKKKTRLQDLSLSFEKGRVRLSRHGLFGDAFKPSDGGRGSEELILNALEPHLDLRSLHIRYYEDLSLPPNWLMSLTKLKTLSLYAAINLMSLPPLGSYRCLKH